MRISSGKGVIEWTCEEQNCKGKVVFKTIGNQSRV